VSAPCEKIDVSEKPLGYVKVIDVAPNGSWLVIEVVEFTRKGGAQRRVRVCLDLFSAAHIASRVHDAILAQQQHLARIKAMAGGSV